MNEKFGEALEIIENGGSVEIKKIMSTMVIRKVDDFVYEARKKDIYGYEEIEDLTLKEVVQYLANQNLERAELFTNIELITRELKARNLE